MREQLQAHTVLQAAGQRHAAGFSGGHHATSFQRSTCQPTAGAAIIHVVQHTFEMDSSWSSGSSSPSGPRLELSSEPHALNLPDKDDQDSMLGTLSLSTPTSPIYGLLRPSQPIAAGSPAGRGAQATTSVPRPPLRPPPPGLSQVFIAQGGRPVPGVRADAARGSGRHRQGHRDPLEAWLAALPRIMAPNSYTYRQHSSQQAVMG